MIVQFIICCALLICLFSFPAAAHLGAEQGLQIFTDILLPYLLPYLLLTNWLFALLQKSAVSRKTAFVISYLVSAVGGYPIGAIATISLYQQQLLSKRQAAWILPFLHSPNPFFVINYVGKDLLENIHFSLMYLMVHHTIAIVAVVIIYKNSSVVEPNFNAPNPSLQSILQNTAQTILTIAITIIFFSSFTYICIELFLTNTPVYVTVLLIGALELTNGLQFANTILSSSLPLYFAFLLTSQSISIHVQALSITYPKLPISPYIFVRTTSTVVMTLLFLY